MRGTPIRFIPRIGVTKNSRAYKRTKIKKAIVKYLKLNLFIISKKIKKIRNSNRGATRMRKREVPMLKIV